MSTKLIVLAAKKQSGKSTLAKFIVNNADAFWPKAHTPPSLPRTPGRQNDARIYSFAGPIKEFCYKVLGLTYEQCYGSDADKNTFTKYWWEDMPHYPRILERLRKEAQELQSQKPWWMRFAEWVTGATPVENYVAFTAPSGLMTARQVLQEVGTGIGRQIDHSLWSMATYSAIKRDNPDVAVIDDCRFPEEADAGWNERGVVIRLERAPFKGKDQHASEISLDGYDRYLGRIPDVGVVESCRALMVLLFTSGLIERIPEDHELMWPEGFSPPSDKVPDLFAAAASVLSPKTDSKYGINLLRKLNESNYVPAA